MAKKKPKIVPITYSIPARKRVVEMRSSTQGGKKGTMVIKADGKGEFKKFKKSKVDLKSPYKRNVLDDAVGREK